MSAVEGLKKWHAVLEAEDREGALSALLHKDAVFHSPVVHTPQKGRALVMAYLGAAGKVLGPGGFTYVREVVDGDVAVLEFTSEIEGIHINGVDIITFDEGGQIIDYKVMVRPLKAINKVWEMMAAQLERAEQA